MPKFKEYPRGGAANGEIVNPGEQHLPCVILLDTSLSMESVQNQLRDGLEALGKAIKEDALAVGRVEFCIITFDDNARILTPFTSAYDFTVPDFDCGGMTATHDAIDLALSEIEARKKQYKNSNTNYYRPWIYLLTDGESNDPDNGSFQRLLEAQNNKKCTFFPVGIGDDINREELKSLRPDGMILTATKENFIGAFTWLSTSMSQITESNPDDKIKLDPPTKHQITVEA
jgi:uncharacterized protein YegL